jgi:molecular chaperone HscB
VYLAGLKGVEMPADGKTIDDPELLMEAMEAREELHEASTIEAVDRLAAKGRDDMKSSLAALPGLFQANDRPAIRKALLRLRYLDKFSEEARARRTNLERKA